VDGIKYNVYSRYNSYNNINNSRFYNSKGGLRTLLIMPKFRRKFLKPTRFNPKGHMYVGVVWPVEGSTGKKYDVELTDEGFECNCHGFGFHGYCKHSKAVMKKVEQTTFDNFVRVL
tara:strand:- start:38 stop:385 length:348 start_codon:yes stop_codon:yes gene_type:complete